MYERITQRLAELKARQASVEQEMAHIEQRRQALLQEMLKLQGAVQTLEGLLEAEMPAAGHGQQQTTMPPVSA
jgi:predicted  nucleic acid-binding Zn-ribbon protein